MDGIIKAVSGLKYTFVSCNQYLEGINSCALWIDEANYGLVMKVTSYHANSPADIILEYIKTTDIISK